MDDDAGPHEEATRYYLGGVRAAEAAGDPSLAANLLSTLSYARANTGHTEDAVLLARSAAIAGRPHAAPAGRALLWDRVAWAHARNGDVELCLKALDSADEAFGRADGEEVPTWAYWLDRRELDVMAGRCLTQLDRPDLAEPLLLEAIAGYDATHSREVALYRSWLAEAYAKAGDVDRACAQTMEVLDAVDGVNSARVDDRVGSSCAEHFIVTPTSRRSGKSRSAVGRSCDPPDAGHVSDVTPRPIGHETPVPWSGQ